MTDRVGRLALSIAALTTVYALMLASLDPGDLLLGALLSLVLVVGLRRFLFAAPAAAVHGLLARMAGVPRFTWAVLREITLGTWRVAAVVLHLRPLTSPGIVLVPIEERTELGAVVSAYAATLAPGEYLVDIDWDRRQLLMHVLDASDPDAVRARFAEFYRRYQREVVP